MTDIIYTPKGRALEYSPLAANLYRGCRHGCVYCYAPAATRQDRAKFYEAGAPREKILEKLEREAAARRGEAGPVLLCFTSDPYQPGFDHDQVTGRAIEILNRHDIPVQVLTKGGPRSVRDLDLLAAGHTDNLYACSLTLLDDRRSMDWEPRAALPTLRIEALRKAAARGIRTWVSLEPVIEPDQTLAVIERSAEFAGHYKVGKLNHHPLAAKIDWRAFRERARETLERLGYREVGMHEYSAGTFYFKEDLREA